MTVLHPISPMLAASYKAVRLRALQDTPSAFGSTYLRESQFSDEEWSRRAANLSGECGMGYLSFGRGGYGGIAGCFLDEDDPRKATVVSVWVAPEMRRTGVGGQLMRAIELWARERGVRVLRLMVTDTNVAAREFYERLGFSRTGRTEPFPNDVERLEDEMEKAL